jgi:cobalt-zinc-cadmium efflux system membrane fusion protein
MTMHPYAHRSIPCGTLPALVLVLLLAACQKGNDQQAAVPAVSTDAGGLITVPDGSPLRTRIDVQAVAAGQATDALELPALVEADPVLTSNILAPLTGRVVALKVGLGDHVTQGQVLATMTSGDLAQAYADDEKARDAESLTQKALARVRGVHEAGGAADKDLEAAVSAENQAKAELVRASARLASLGGNASDPAHLLVITAPQAGVVTAITLAGGAQVSDPTATLMTITNLERVFVTAHVDEGRIGTITLGTPADIALIAYPGRTLHGPVTEINSFIEPDTRRQKVRIALANGDGQLMPNMYATVRFAVPSAGGVHVPQSALVMNNDTVTVLIEVKPWVFKRRVITIGDETEQEARVLSGLSVGDRIVVKGGVLLND